MRSMGVRVQRPVRLGRGVEGLPTSKDLGASCVSLIAIWSSSVEAPGSRPELRRNVLTRWIVKAKPL